MSQFETASDLDFFGKDPAAFFLGQVEDVNDPKGSNRVKVRIFGWHPAKKKQGKDGNHLKTHQLPWAKVAMPTTHAQVARVGGKHGLLVGSWVIGIFLDGQEAQKPMVLNSFNLTSKSIGKDIKQEPGETTGKMSEDVDGFTNVYLQDEYSEGTGTKTSTESGKGTSAETDPEGDNALNMVDPKPCGQPPDKSVSDEDTEGELKKDGSPKARGQKYKFPLADGLCGSTMSARGDIETIISENFPSQATRFVFNDSVWNAFSGNHIDMNGVLAQIAILICNLLKQPINSSKAAQNDLDRLRAAVQQQAIPDRTGFVSEIEKIANSLTGDLFNGIFGASFIDILCSLIMALLQGINNGDQGDGGDNAGGDIGGDPNTPIQNPDAPCITDLILNDVNVLTNEAIEAAHAAADNAVRNGTTGNSIDIGAILGILAGLMSILQFPLMQKYATKRGQNAAGPMSQDDLIKTIGCALERMYSTWQGAQAVSGGSGSSLANSSVTRYEGVGFGGLREDEMEDEVSTIVCEDATVPVFPDPSYPGNPHPGDQPNRFPNDPSFPGWGTKPDGEGGVAGGISLPSDNEVCAKNFINGTPNQVVVVKRGSKYFYNNNAVPQRAFPSVYIPGYNGTPVPVVDRDSGELVALLTSCVSWSPNHPGPPISVIPDDNPTGITTDDPNYDVVLGGIFIGNTGREYCDPQIEIFDLDRASTEAAEAKAVVVDGRIVNVDIINNGTGFKRLPRVRVLDNGSKCGTRGGWGAELYPIMSLVARPNAKPAPEGVQMVYCPATNQKNLLDPVKNPSAMIAKAMEATLASIT